MPRDKENSVNGVNLEPNHSHFVLVDNGAENSKAWGSEIQFRFVLEKEYSSRRKVPRVLVVVQGGPGTLQSISEAIIGECPVVLVRDSGGIATLLHHFLSTYHDEKGAYYQKGHIPSKLSGVDERFLRTMQDPKHRAKLTNIAELDSKCRKVSSFSLTVSSTAELDLHVLNAIINDSAQCKPGDRLKLAVEWGRADVVQR
eukprot:6696214-Prymnesium_polylepis.1